MESKSVHFTVDPQWATDFVRTRWGEGNFQWCYEFLESCGVQDRETAKKIIWGTSKFVQYSEEFPNDFALSNDEWKADPDENHLCQYPNPFIFEEVRVAQERLVQDEAEKQASHIHMHYMDREENATRLGVVYPYTDDFSRQKSPLELLGDRLLSEETLNQEISQQDTVSPSDMFENGIITPNGEFYRCGVMGHNGLAEKLGYAADHDAEEYDNDGNDPASRAVIDGCFVLSLTLNAKKVRRPENPTREQRKKIAEWYGHVSYSDASVMELNN